MQFKPFFFRNKFFFFEYVLLVDKHVLVYLPFIHLALKILLCNMLWKNNILDALKSKQQWFKLWKPADFKSKLYKREGGKGQTYANRVE